MLCAGSMELPQAGTQARGPHVGVCDTERERQDLQPALL